MNKRTVREIDVENKTVLVRADLNVPFRPDSNDISDDTRIRASLPTVRYLIGRRCRVVLCSHLGRPNGRAIEDLRMGPVSDRLSELLGVPVAQATDCVGAEVKALVDGLPPGGVALLENLRFHPGEEKNGPEFAEALASLAEIYVNDAFGAAHRAHASTRGVARLLPAVAGMLMARELEALEALLSSPPRPFAAVLGGAKVSDKLEALRNLARLVDVLLVGGGMAATFLKAQGHDVGASLVEEDRVVAAGELMGRADNSGPIVMLPTDVVVADEFSAVARHRVVGVGEVPPTWRIMDIGPRTASAFAEALGPASTVVWNGPMGVAEWGPFAEGTTRVAKALAGLKGAMTVIGGGSTAETVRALGLSDTMTHVSTGGGATLEFLEGKTLPGVAELMDRTPTAV